MSVSTSQGEVGVLHLNELKLTAHDNQSVTVSQGNAAINMQPNLVSIKIMAKNTDFTQQQLHIM